MHELDGEEPWEAAVGQRRLAAGSNRVADLRDVRSDVLHAGVIQTVDPQAGVGALHGAVQSMQHAAEYGKKNPVETRRNVTANTDPRAAKMRLVLQDRRQYNGCQRDERRQHNIGGDLCSAAPQDWSKDLKHHPDEEHDVHPAPADRGRSTAETLLHHTQHQQLASPLNLSASAGTLTSAAEVSSEQQLAGERKHQHHHGNIRRTQASEHQEHQSGAPEQQADVEEKLGEVHGAQTLGEKQMTRTLTIRRGFIYSLHSPAHRVVEVLGQRVYEHDLGRGGGSVHTEGAVEVRVPEHGAPQERQEESQDQQGEQGHQPAQEGTFHRESGHPLHGAESLIESEADCVRSLTSLAPAPGAEVEERGEDGRQIEDGADASRIRHRCNPQNIEEHRLTVKIRGGVGQLL
ncbi:hypothetical protein DNTS_032782 [Danionella cerebrum]|uniref:Uncharacterized protein n=1 Tax=Danionella cerebrum TaxID=2873325 RepID=A0A553R4K4_9TELE|nr:hypothetical protein DNTS_032782 [Danionella translucida]